MWTGCGVFVHYYMSIFVVLIKFARLKIALHPYATEWPVIYEYEKYLLLQALNVPQIDIEHIGSTAVPGLSAKPVIDIMIGIPGDHPLDLTVKPLLDIGYIYVRYYEQFEPEQKFFIRIDDQHKPEKNIIDRKDDQINRDGFEHTHHLHVVQKDSQCWHDHLKFRNHLRNHPADRLVYELLKKQLADNEWETISDYTRAKTNFIKMILSRPL